MIIIDEKLNQLEKIGKPIQVGMVGAGFMAQGIANQIINYTKGMRLVAIANRTLSKAEAIYSSAGIPSVKQVKTVEELSMAIKDHGVAITDNATLLIENPHIDVILEATGDIDYGASVVMKTIRAGKHIVTMSAELDATIGPILKSHADEAGVVYTVADGDQPGVTQNLISFVRGLGIKLVLCGNIKGLHDPYRNPTTQEGFAKKWGQNPAMVTSFADGSKISFEQTATANANGLTVAKRGMYGPTVTEGTQVADAPGWYPSAALTQKTGIVDYVVGASPAPGVFVIGTTKDSQHKHYLNLYKLGEGPYYVFYVPYHLCHFEVPSSIARAVIFNNATVAPLAGPMVEVIATAKIDLKKGMVLDGIGEYMTYGLCENHDTARAEGLLPMGLTQGCTLTRDIKKDQVLVFEDVILPEKKLSYKLWQEQEKVFAK